MYLSPTPYSHACAWPGTSGWDHAPWTNFPVWRQTCLVTTGLCLTMVTDIGADSDLQLDFPAWPALSPRMTWTLGWPWLPSPGLAAGLAYVLWDRVLAGGPCNAGWVILLSSPIGNCWPLLLPEPWKVSMEGWRFWKTHLGVKHFLN